MTDPSPTLEGRPLFPRWRQNENHHNLDLLWVFTSTLYPGQASSVFHLEPLILYRDHFKVPLANLSAPTNLYLPLLSSMFGGLSAGTVPGCSTLAA